MKIKAITTAVMFVDSSTVIHHMKSERNWFDYA